MKEKPKIGDYYKVIDTDKDDPNPSIDSIILITDIINDKDKLKELCFIDSIKEAFEYKMVRGENNKEDKTFSFNCRLFNNYLEKLSYKKTESDLLIEQSKKLYNL